MDLDCGGVEDVYLFVTGSFYLLTGRGFPDQTNYNKLEVWEGRNPGILVVISGSEAICLLVFSALETYALYPMSINKKLVELLPLDKVKIPPYSVFIRHGCLQHKRCTRRCPQSLRYHTCLNI